MSDNKKVVEQHGCIVCGKTHSLLVVYSPSGQLHDLTLTNSGARRVPDPRRPLVACDTHSSAEIETAYVKRYPGRKPDDEEEG